MVNEQESKYILLMSYIETNILFSSVTLLDSRITFFNINNIIN